MAYEDGEPVKLLVLSEAGAQDVLRAAAIAMSLNINSDTGWETDTSMTANLLWGFGNLARLATPLTGIVTYARHGHYFMEKLGSQQYSINQTKFARDQAWALELFRRNFSEQLALGDEEAKAYLEMRIRDTQYAWEAVKFKIAATNTINGEVMAEIDQGIRRATVACTVCNTIMAVGLCFVPGSWVAVTAASAGYHIACELVSGSSPAGRADVIGYARDGGVNFAQQTSTHAVTAKIISGNRDHEKFLAQKIAQYSREGGRAPTSAQAKRLRVLRGKAVQSQKIRARVGGAATVVNLYFMKDEIARALGYLWQEVAPEVRDDWETQFRQSSAGGH